ncbi:MAG: hypothetical protein LBF58_11875 [Deltaproteobacteria bacterium]|jgi:predicted transposase/invertase (TIGR01784 family)|nr:hypothetical protein [Deltaproteobacteria bacterium]
MPAETKQAIAQACAIVGKLSADKSAREIAEAMDKRRRNMASIHSDCIEIGEERGKKIGEKIGKRKKTVEIAKNCLRKKMSHADVAEGTGLSLDEVKRLAADL